MKHFKSILALILALVMVLSCVGTSFAASKDISDKTPVAEISKNNTVGTKSEALKGFQRTGFKEINSYQYADDEIVRAIVLLEGECEADVAESGSEKAAAHHVKLVNQHNNVRKAMSGIKYEMKFDFTRLLNGFSCDVAYGDLEAIAAIEGVEAVHIANHYENPKVEVVKDEKQAYSNSITGNDAMISGGLDGYGIVVAVLDTGLNTTHEAFQDVAGYAAEYGVLTKEDVEAADLYVDGAYLSAKVPFAYDYADGDADVTDADGHGTHVSGSAVGMAATLAEDGESLNITFCGSAPAAQLLSMKIFKDAGGGTSSDIYFYALEDAYTLGADVINMSIGAQNGFTFDDSLETEVFGNIYKRLEESGIIMSVAAGNEYSMAYNASMYAGYKGAIGMEYTDYGTVAAPSTYEGNISVASLENYAYPEFVIEIGGEIVTYVDSCDDGEHGWLDTFGDTAQDYVLVPGANGTLSLGTEEDFAKVDVAGKIAVISRGELDFEVKVENAYKAGAIGCVVVNNQEGIISMAIETFEIPAITMQKSALEVLLSDTTGKLVTYKEKEYVTNPEALLMSEFSNWGTSPMLTLDPTITSIGGKIYSSVPGDTDTYEVYSGTSMAAPNASGTYANLLSALYTYNPELTKVEAAELARNLMYANAYTITDADGYLYSPRKQGAGLASSYESINAYLYSAYITNPIQELGDDPEKTGVFDFSVTVKNDGEYDIHYSDFEAYVMYDYPYNVGEDEVTLINTLTSEYAYYMDEATSEKYEISGANVSYSIDGTEISEFDIMVGEEVTVDVKITLTEDLMAFFDAYYPNGAFVEGFVNFNDTLDGEKFDDTHATFLAYYGDWTQASVLEETDFRDIVEAEIFLNTTVVDAEGNTYGDYGYTYANSGIMDFYTNPNTAYLVDSAVTTAYAYAGDNMLGYTDYYEEHIAFSTPLTDGTWNYAELIYMEPYQLRNARHLIMTVSNKETGEIYYVDDTEYLPKSSFSNDYNAWMPYGVFMWDGTDAKNEYVPSGTVATITYDAILPFGDAEQKNIWSFDVTVDYTAPTVDSVDFDKEAKTLTVTATDEQFLQAIYLTDDDYTVLDQAIFSSDKMGESFTATFDVSKYIVDGELNIKVIALDYATNEMEEDFEMIVDGKCYVEDFSDCEGAWYHEAVDFAVANGLMNGISKSKFDPEGSLTRAMVVTVLYREAGAPEVEEASTFTDVAADEWYSDAIAWAQDVGVVNGVTATLFAPDEAVTREQIATILWRYAGSPAAEKPDEAKFKDLDKISAYAEEAMAWAISEGIFCGDDDACLNPTDTATRAEFACIIMRYLKGCYTCTKQG